MEMKTKIVCVLAAMIVGGTSGLHAQQEMLDVENGKAVRHIAFDQEQVTVNYKDGSQEENVQNALFVFSSEVVGIRDNNRETINNNGETINNNGYYDLQGRRISQPSTLNAQPRRGIWIVKNGNKTTIRINK